MGERALGARRDEDPRRNYHAPQFENVNYWYLVYIFGLQRTYSTHRFETAPWRIARIANIHQFEHHPPPEVRFWMRPKTEYVEGGAHASATSEPARFLGARPTLLQRTTARTLTMGLGSQGVTAPGVCHTTANKNLFGGYAGHTNRRQQPGHGKRTPDAQRWKHV